MTERVASILAEIGIDSSTFSSGSKQVMDGIDKMLRGFGALVPGIGAAVAVAGTLYAAYTDLEKAANESAKTQAKLDAVIRSTGGAAGLTSKELGELSAQLSKSAGMDDELIASSEAVLLTFTKLGSGVFPATMQAAVDMSAVLGTDLQGSVMQLGKAMNDFSGYTALKRAGVSFTESQVVQIKRFKETNDLIGYQQLILGELKTEFGGAAKAINDAGDSSENLAIAWENLKEVMGEGFVKNTKKSNDSLVNLLDDMARGIDAANEYAAALDSLGITFDQETGFMQNGISISQERVTALTKERIALIAAEDADVDRIKALQWNKQATKDAADATDGLADATDTASKNTEVFTQNTTALYNDMFMYNQAAKEAEATTRRNADALVEASEEALGLSFALSGGLGKEMDNFERTTSELNQDLRDVNARLDELQTKKTKSGLTKAEQKEVEELKKKLEELKKQHEENAAAHQLATKKILFDMLQQRLAADGVITAEEQTELAEIAAKWGLIDKATFDAYTEMDNYVDKVEDGTEKIEDLSEAAEGVARSYLIEFDVRTNMPAWLLKLINNGWGGAPGSGTGGGGGEGSGGGYIDQYGNWVPPSSGTQSFAPGEKGVNQSIVISIPMYLDGMMIGRGSFNGTLAEAQARGLKFEAVK